MVEGLQNEMLSDKTNVEFINPYPAKVIYLNFHPLEIVSRYRDPQLQVGENYSYLFDLGPVLMFK